MDKNEIFSKALQKYHPMELAIFANKYNEKFNFHSMDNFRDWNNDPLEAVTKVLRGGHYDGTALGVFVSEDTNEKPVYHRNFNTRAEWFFEDRNGGLVSINTKDITQLIRDMFYITDYSEWLISEKYIKISE